MNKISAEVAERVRSVFLIPESVSDLTASLNKDAQALPSHLKPVALAFLDNVEGILRTLGIPFHYTYSQVHSLHWQRIATTERIRSLTIEDLEKRDQVARDTAKARFHEFITGDGGSQIANDVLDRLSSLQEEPESLSAARELTRQGVVLIWSGFEVLARDIFVSLLNANPSIVDRLLSHPASRKRFTVEKVDWQTLGSFGYNLSSSLGTLLSQRVDLDDIQTIRDAFGGLFPNSKPLNESLASSRLWRLFQRRNLIVHRRGVVDQQYVDKTGDTIPIGTHLWIVPAEIEEYLAAVVHAAAEMLREAAS